MTGSEIEVLKYCYGRTDEMWAACVVGIILKCDFRDSTSKLQELVSEGVIYE